MDSSPTRLIVHLIHGTWPEGIGVSLKRWLRPGLKYTPEHGDRFWFQTDHVFRRRLAGALAEAGFTAEFRSFVWSGANSFAARRDAAEEFVPHLVAGMRDGMRQLIVAHSHGGTVAMLAMQLIELGATPGAFGAADEPLRWAPARREAGNALTIAVEDVVELPADRVRAGLHELELVTLATPFMRVEPFGSSGLLWSAFATCWITAFATLAVGVARHCGETAAYLAMAGATVLGGLMARALANARRAVERGIIAPQAHRFVGKRIQCIRGVADEAELTISAGIVGCNLVRTLLVFAGRRLATATAPVLAAAYVAAIAILAWATLARPDSEVVVWLYASGALAAAFVVLLALGSSLQSLLGVELALSGFAWLTTVESSPDADRCRIEIVTLAATQDTAENLRHAVYLHPQCAQQIAAGLGPDATRREV